MRRFLAGVGFAMGLAWLLRWRRKPQPAGGSTVDPADELKRKLAESRAEPPEQPEPKLEAPAAPLDERRRAVHDRARASIEQMRGEKKAE